MNISSVSRVALIVKAVFLFGAVTTALSSGRDRWKNSIGYVPYWRRLSYIYQPSNSAWKPTNYEPDNVYGHRPGANLADRVFRASAYRYNPYKRILDNARSMKNADLNEAARRKMTGFESDPHQTSVAYDAKPMQELRETVGTHRINVQQHSQVQQAEFMRVFCKTYPGDSLCDYYP